MSKNFKVILLFSLIVNFLLLGIVVGEITHEKPHPPFSGMDDKNLPPEIREKLRNEMSENFKKTKPLRDKIDQTRQEAINILQKDNFDESAFEQKLDELFTLMGQMGHTMTDSVKKIARDAPAKDRANIARMLMRRPPNSEDCKPNEVHKNHREDSGESKNQP